MTLQLLHSEFPYSVYEENLIFFFISVCYVYFTIKRKIYFLPWLHIREHVDFTNQ
jgi:hypothetical protein